MRILENFNDIEEIEAMLFKVREAFLFIPFKAYHKLQCTQIVYLVKGCGVHLAAIGDRDGFFSTRKTQN